MAYFVLEYAYGDMEARARARPRHLDYMRGLHAQGTVLMAGPIDDGAGAMVVYEAADQAQVRELISQDPYSQEGVLVDVTVREWSVVIPADA
jgi:uncharacterized protein YciI